MIKDQFYEPFTGELQFILFIFLYGSLLLTFLGCGRFRFFPPIGSFSIVNESLDDERHTVELSHTQVELLRRDLKCSG